MHSLIEALRLEYANLERESHLNKMQRDEYQRKIQQQLHDMTIIQNRIVNLEKNHIRMKADSEKEILRLKKILDGGDVSSFIVPTSSITNNSVHNIPASLPKPDSIATEEAPVPEEDDEVESDWIVGYNPASDRNLKIQLCSDLEHLGVVSSVNFSENGQFLATGSNGSVRIFNSDSGSEVKLLRVSSTDNYFVRSVVYSPDGKYLATGSEDKTVKIWDLEQESIDKEFEGHELDIYSVKYSQNGKFIVSGSGDKTIKIWDVDNGDLLNTLTDFDNGPMDGVTSVCITPDSRQVISGSLDRLVCVWDVETGQLVRSMKGHTDSVYSISISPDGSQICSGSLDKTIKVWSVNTGSDYQEFKGHRDFVLSVAYSPEGDYIVSGSKDKTVHFWDLRGGIAQMILKGHQNSVISVAMVRTLDGVGKLATGSGDSRARIWEWQKNITNI